MVALLYVPFGAILTWGVHPKSFGITRGNGPCSIPGFGTERVLVGVDWDLLGTERVLVGVDRELVGTERDLVGVERHLLATASVRALYLWTGRLRSTLPLGSWEGGGERERSSDSHNLYK